MRKGVWILVALSVLALTAGCASGDETATALPTHRPQSTDSPEPAATQEPTATLESGSVDPAPVCPPAKGEGTIVPAVSIYSITFVVNDLEQVVRSDDMLQVLPGDKVQVRRVTVCTGAFSGSGGEACVDFAPVDQDGQELMSEHGGTHMVRVVPGFTSIPGPDHTWIIDENWTQFSGVLNHWAAEDTEDRSCADGRCERDDRIIVRFR